jgi:UDP-N-acetylmuramoylalanine--D-glutamate ligase
VGLLDKKRLLVVGLGKSGMAVTRLLAKKGYQVVITDDNAQVVYAASADTELAGLGDRIEPVLIDMAGRALEECGCVIASPGVPLDHDLIVAARAAGVAVTGELEIASRFCSSPVVGVSGTNGKSTVVSLIGDIFKTAGLRTVVAGNIGTPLSAVVDTKEPWNVVVLEISSFQLDTISEFKPRVAVLLNVTPDHLDRYNDSFDEYARSKARILNNADDDTVFVYNADDPTCKGIAGGFEGTKIPFSSSRKLSEGVYSAEDALVRTWSGRTERMIAVDRFPPVGIHNLENAMAAVAAVTPFDIETSHIERALASYRPLPHRMEPVRTARGVVYINDSKATNVDATIKSLRSIDGNVILIMGGLDKKGDFGMLVEHLGRVKLIILIGDAKEKIKKVLAGKCRLLEAETMEEAVVGAAVAGTAGDTVLLAPACASFDMFENYAQRGEVFRAAVAALED